MNRTAKDYWQYINARIKELRTTQEAVCNETGIKYQTLRGMITKGIYPRLPDAAAIAAALNVSIDYTWQQTDSNAADCFYRRFGHFENVLQGYESLSQNDKNTVTNLVAILARKK